MNPFDNAPSSSASNPFDIGATSDFANPFGPAVVDKDTNPFAFTSATPVVETKRKSSTDSYGDWTQVSSAVPSSSAPLSTSQQNNFSVSSRSNSINSPPPKSTPLPKDLMSDEEFAVEKQIQATQRAIADVQASATPLPQVTGITLRVSDYEIVNNSYVLYLIEVGQYGVIQILKKRFSQIYDFSSALALKGVRGPARHLMKNSLEPHFIQDRVKEIQAYFIELELQPNLPQNPKFAEFFQLADLDQKKQDAFFLQNSALNTALNNLSKVSAERDLLLDKVEQLTTLKEMLLEKIETMNIAHEELQTRHNDLSSDHQAQGILLQNKENQISEILSAVRTILTTHESF